MSCYLILAYSSMCNQTYLIRLLELVVTVRERTLAEDHPDRLASQHALAGAYESDGQVTFRGGSDRVVAAGHRRGKSASQPARLDPKSAAAADTSTIATPHHAKFVAPSMADQACWRSEEATTRPPVSTARF